MKETGICGHVHELPPPTHHHKCEYCKKDGAIYRNERSNANAMIANGCLIMSGNIKTTVFQTLFTEIPFCPFCGQRLRK
ncbi:MAG: hypothetical protein WC998_05190 [Candidatus Paceibacterota bacterium]|jgi:hypothetical protein